MIKNEEEKEVELKLVNKIKANIRKGIKTIIGYTYLYPNTKHIYIQLYVRGSEFGYFNNKNEKIPLFIGNNEYTEGKRYLEAFDVKAFTKLYDELGLEDLMIFFLNKKAALVKKVYNQMIKEEKNKVKEEIQTNKDENK